MRRAALLYLIVFLGACGTASAGHGAGIDGKVVAGPTCPVERVPPDPQCAPRPLAATLRVHPAGKRSPVTTLHSGSNGLFKIRLAPGLYVVVPQAKRGSPFPRPPSSQRVRVRAGRFARITITDDTGIR